ncbi:hypothetical protein [Mesorhizobium tianshanense]|nr:hypothetical protein [Mesorhizobium tianshanense]
MGGTVAIAIGNALVAEGRASSPISGLTVENQKLRVISASRRPS